MYAKSMIIGRAGRDPEMRYTPSGNAVTDFSVAADIGWGDKKSAIWFQITAWNNLAEVVNKYVHKGDMLYVEGEFKPDDNGNPRTWTRQDGSAGASYELTASKVIFLSTKREDAPEPQKENQEDIPF